MQLKIPRNELAGTVISNILSSELTSLALSQVNNQREQWRFKFDKALPASTTQVAVDSILVDLTGFGSVPG